MDWEQRVAALWADFDNHSEEDFIARMGALADELPAGDPIGLYERGSAFDSTGDSASAIPFYREALARNLPGHRRRECVIQMGSSLRNVGELAESIAMLQAERDRQSDELDDAVAATLALALTDAGREREAVSVAVLALTKHMVRFKRSMTNYGKAIAEPKAG